MHLNLELPKHFENEGKKERRRNLPTHRIVSIIAVYLPIYATIARVIMNKCSVRERDYSIWLLDEASVLKFKLLYRVLATLRTYRVLIVWCLQDKVQGELLYNIKELKAILTNLGLQIIGKANDPETAEYYTKLFETIEEEEKSVSSGGGRESVTKSMREKKKYKAIVFRRLLAGEFFMIDKNGIDRKFRFKPIPYSPVLPDPVNFYSTVEIERHFDSVFEQVREILSTVVVPESSDFG